MQETQETWVQSLDWEDLLEEEMATHSSILARVLKTPWTEEPGGTEEPWGHKESEMTEHAQTWGNINSFMPIHSVTEVKQTSYLKDMNQQSPCMLLVGT